jgi:hypothetical protein
MRHPIRSVIRRFCWVRLAALVLAALLISDSAARAHHSLGQHVLSVGLVASGPGVCGPREFHRRFAAQVPVSRAQPDSNRIGRLCRGVAEGRRAAPQGDLRGGSIAPEEYGLCMAWTATARERELKRLFGLVASSEGEDAGGAVGLGPLSGCRL